MARYVPTCISVASLQRVREEGMRLVRGSQRELDIRAGRLRKRAQVYVCSLKKGRGNFSKRVLGGKKAVRMDKVVQLDIQTGYAH